ncbi:MAG: SDR family oxidoreductase [Clostridia bacterium]|nr:SDR family oxidoreductase [Clostridia bacterium]
MNNGSQVVVITGAAQGIGRSIATRFHRSSAKLALLDMDIKPFQEWIKELGRDVLLVKCNVTNRLEVEAARDQILAHFGRIDVLINNAGIGKSPHHLEEVKEEDWRQVLDVNLTGVFLCTQVFGTSMLDRGGAIVNISSMSGLIPSPLRGAYSASKAGVLMLTAQTALAWGRRKVRANAVCPGIIETTMATRNYKGPGSRQARIDLVPSGRLGTPEDVANVVFFLASPESEYINGEFIRVDGGFTLTTMLQYSNI